MKKLFLQRFVIISPNKLVIKHKKTAPDFSGQFFFIFCALK